MSRHTKHGTVVRSLGVGDGAYVPIPPGKNQRRLMRERVRRVVYSIAAYYGRKFRTQCTDTGITIRRTE